ncbi:MAG: VWA domain-containing protein [Deltaproteobacteria bacterium]|nr:VWA domain-containing protein [Deltaproteobacteria bacterium]
MLMRFSIIFATCLSVIASQDAYAQQCNDQDQDHDGYSCLSGDCNDSDPDIHVNAPELCDGKDNDCNDVVDDPADDDQDGFNECQGDCDDNDPDRFPGNPEDCDGKDNDCNASTRDVDLTQSCYTFAAATRHVGECHDGTYACNGTAWSTTCAGQQGPATEICDNKDNDCDRSTDEGLTVDGDGDGVRACGTCNAPAAPACDCADNDADRFPGNPEVCDGKDNDCNASTRDVDITEECYTFAPATRDVGDCHHGTRTCTGSTFGACTGEQGPTTEVCDGRDNDCDRSTDEGLIVDQDGDGVRACGTCNAPAAPACDCDDTTNQVRPGRNESCDGLDNDCDGDVDENLAPRNCWSVTPANQRFDRGVCHHGTQVCNAVVGSGVASYGACTGESPPEENSGDPASPEAICDGRDGDCDGTVDDLPGINDDGDPARDCAVCAYDASGQPILPSACDCDDSDPLRYPGRPEICDNKDNDCNGSIDENFDQDNDNCSTCNGDCNDNNPAVYGCFGGAPELVDCLDNDCDGQTDESAPDADGDGYRAGSLSCHDCDDSNIQRHPGATERCNNVDDDCDGRVDEDPNNQNQALRESCYEGPNGTVGNPPCHAGVRVCDSTVPAFGPCQNQVLPTTETCNDIDDDCDRTVDEGFDQDGDSYKSCGANADCDDNDADRHPGNQEVCDGKDNDCNATTDDSTLTEPCYTGPSGTEDEGLCVGGHHECLGVQGYGAVCIDEVTPTSGDECDGFDNDCDGEVDEGFDQDQDGYTSCAGDCDDQNPAIHPTALDICNNIDDDCDGTIDGNDTPCYTGPVGTSTVGLCHPGTATCVAGQPDVCHDEVVPTDEICDGEDNDCDGLIDEDFDLDHDGIATCAGDCDDTNPFVAPGLPERCDCMDNDCDGSVDEDDFGRSVCEFGACHDFDDDGFTNCDSDCNDRDPSAYPGAPEICGDGVDNDCDGFADEDVDEDGDGYTTCDGDCDDRFDSIHPGATEVCDGFNNDCDPVPPKGACDPANTACTYHAQCCSGLCGASGRCETCGAQGVACSVDGDCCAGLCNPNGKCASPIDEGFDLDGDNATTCQNDCDDHDPTRSPFLREVCGNGVDDDCDGVVDPETDNDKDGYTFCGGDCNDFNRSVHPGALEVCDDQDNDCDGVFDYDEGFDLDHDGWLSCFGDCDDNNPNINPDIREQIDGIDNNCNGLVDEGQDDKDGDGFSYLCGDCDDSNPEIGPQAWDICDSQDNDCDGRIDFDPWGVRTCKTCNDVDGDGVTDCDGDCDDLEPRVRPGGTEVCDGLDNNCDGKIDLDQFTDENLCVLTDAGPLVDTGAPDAGPTDANDSKDGEVGDADAQTSAKDVVSYSCGCNTAASSESKRGAGTAHPVLGFLSLFVLALFARRRRGLGLGLGLGRRLEGGDDRAGHDRGGSPGHRVAFFGLFLLGLALLSPIACTSFDVGGRVDDSISADAGPRDGANTDGDAGPSDIQGGSDSGPRPDATPGDGGPFNEGPCRFQAKDQPRRVILPDDAYELALHDGVSAVSIPEAAGIGFMDEGRGLFGFAIKTPSVPSIDTSSKTASREYLDQFIDPLFTRAIPGVVGVAERVDETFRQNFDRLNHPATRTYRTITMVNDVLPSRLRDGLLTALTGVPVAQLGVLEHPTNEAPTRQIRFAAYVEADPLAFSYKIIVLVAPASQSEAVATRFGDLTNGTHIGSVGDSVVIKCEDQLAQALRVDFIWVVDNSNSMREEQEALAEAADAFFQALSASQVSYRLGVVTTDGEALRGGDFTTDVDAFKQRVRVGINGNGGEQGLEYAVRALEYASTTTQTAERLRDDAVPVVVFYSDEDSLNLRTLAAYEDILRSKGALAFAIVGPRPRGCLAIGRGTANVGASYIDVAEALGGTTASICADDLTGPIQEMLVTAAGAASQTQLDGLPISGSLEVALTTSTVARSRVDGFDYEAAANALLFFGDGNLAEGQPFRVTYLEYLPFNP